MLKLRKDYLLDRWVIISEQRGKRPHEFKTKTKLIPPKIDFFAPGSEHLTPAETGRLEKDGKWIIRWFPNKFAAVSSKHFGKPKGQKHLQSMPAYGYHEVIAETRSRTKQLWELSEQQIYYLLRVYENRIKELGKQAHIKYVQIFKNHGKDAGTSLIHSHTQVIALPKVPKVIREKLAAIKKHKLNYESIVKKETKTKRKALETKHFIAICPFASRFNYEVWVFPKKRYKTLGQMDVVVQKDLAKIMSKILRKLKQMGCSFNYHVHYAPKRTNLLFHVEFTPRLAQWAGFEFSSGIVINSVAPEDAAAFYRKK